MVPSPPAVRSAPRRVGGIRAAPESNRHRDQGDGPGRRLVVPHHGFSANSRTNWVLPGIVDALVADGRRVAAVEVGGVDTRAVGGDRVAPAAQAGRAR